MWERAYRVKAEHYNHLMRTRGFPGGSDDRESAGNSGDTGSIPG